MAYTIILDPTVLASGDTENVIVLVDTSGSVNQEVSLAIDYTDYYKRIAIAIETIATNSTTIAQKLSSIEDHLNTSGTVSNLASKITTISEEITTIDDHLDTQGIAGNLASKITTISEEITTIDDHLDINQANSLAGKFSNIQSHLNSFEQTYQIFLTNVSGNFLENEIVRDSSLNTARVIGSNNNLLYIDSVINNLPTNGITGLISGATATITDFESIKNIARESTEFYRQEDVSRLILNPGGTNRNVSIVYSRASEGGTLQISSPGNITIDEKDILSFSSINSTFVSNQAENIFITTFANPTSLSNEFYNNSNISGQGTRQITWNTTYADAGTYYWFTESKNRSGTITVNFKGFKIDEKVQGASGGIGYVKSYTPISEIDLRIIEVQAIEEKFFNGETITGNFTSNSAVISDVIRINSASFGSNGAFAEPSIGSAALYQLYVENGQILEGETLSPAEQLQARIKVRSLIEKARNI